jgi:hypothetical protein
MGAIGGDEMAQWDKADGGEVVNGGAGGLEKILVSVRLRPLSEKEIARGDLSEWECINDTTVIARSAFPDRPSAPTAYSFGWCILSLIFLLIHPSCACFSFYLSYSSLLVQNVHFLIVLTCSELQIYLFGSTNSRL